MAWEIGRILHPRDRRAWRSWLQRNHRIKSEIWLRRFRKDTGKKSISYDDMVEECLCFGWIDGVIKKLDEESSVQRISPRRPKKSFLSELNRQRVWKLQKLGLMTPAGLAPIEGQIGSPDDAFEVPAWIRKQLKADRLVWKNFEAFPRFYKRLKIRWIAEIKGDRGAEAQKRLDYLIKMTAQKKRYGTEPLAGMEELFRQ